MTTNSEACGVCHRDPKRMNSDIAECSHVDCPSRRKAWSERPEPARASTKGYPKNVDPLPVDKEFQ